MSGRPTEPRRLASGGAERRDDRAAADLLARLPDRMLQPSAAAQGSAEPASPADSDRIARERVWREVVETLPVPGRPRGRRWLPVLALAAGATAVALVFALRLGLGDSFPARLELTAGSVLAAAPEHDWVPARAGASLPEASRLRTDGRSRAVVALSRSAVLVDPTTDLGLESLRGKTFLRLSGGELVAEVEHRQPGESFVVQTTRYRVTVKGTIFSVRELAPDDVTVSVSRGLVEVAGQGGAWEVPAGRSWNSRQPARLGSDDISERERSLLERASVAGPRAVIEVEGNGVEVSEGGLDLGPAPVSWDAPVGKYHFVGKTAAGQAEADASANEGSSATVTLAVAAAAVQAMPAPAQAPALDPCVGTACAPAPLELLDRGSPVEEPAIPVKSVRREQKQRRFEAAAERPSQGEGDRREAAAANGPSAAAAIREPELLARLDKPLAAEPEAATPIAPAPMPIVTAPPPVVMAPDPYAQAVALSRGGQYDAAAQALAAIAAGRGAHADLALYDLARLRQRHLGDPLGALAALVRYEKEYPHGSLAQEVELSAIELELGRSNLEGALSQMDRFLDEHPDSERAPEVHLLRGNVLRGRGDWHGALAEYRRARGDGQGPVEDDRLYYTAFCQQKLGKQDDAAESLRDYQQRFPNGHHLAEARAALQGR